MKPDMTAEKLGAGELNRDDRRCGGSGTQTLMQPGTDDAVCSGRGIVRVDCEEAKEHCDRTRLVVRPDAGLHERFIDYQVICRSAAAEALKEALATEVSGQRMLVVDAAIEGEVRELVVQKKLNVMVVSHENFFKGENRQAFLSNRAAYDVMNIRISDKAIRDKNLSPQLIAL